MAEVRVYQSQSIFLVVSGSGAEAVGQVLSEGGKRIGGPTSAQSILAHTSVSEPWIEVTHELASLPKSIQEAAQNSPNMGEENPRPILWGKAT